MRHLPSAFTQSDSITLCSQSVANGNYIETDTTNDSQRSQEKAPFMSQGFNWMRQQVLLGQDLTFSVKGPLSLFYIYIYILFIFFFFLVTLETNCLDSSDL